MEKPKKLDNIDLTMLISKCEEYINFIDNDEEYHEDNDFNQYIFETALESIFGDKVWDFVNNRQE